MPLGLIPTATRSYAWKRKPLGSRAAPFIFLVMHLGWTSLRRRFCHFPRVGMTIKSTPYRKACNVPSYRGPWVPSKVGGHANLLGDDLNFIGTQVSATLQSYCGTSHFSLRVLRLDCH